MTQFCAACFAEFETDASRCPRCGSSATGLSERDYEDKLLRALEHPLGDVRIRAIIALGLRQRAGTAAALVACALRLPTDVVQGLEIVARLASIEGGRPAVAALRELADAHPAHAIRQAAELALRAVRPPPRG